MMIMMMMMMLMMPKIRCHPPFLGERKTTAVYRVLLVTLSAKSALKRPDKSESCCCGLNDENHAGVYMMMNEWVNRSTQSMCPGSRCSWTLFQFSERKGSLLPAVLGPAIEVLFTQWSRKYWLVPKRRFAIVMATVMGRARSDDVGVGGNDGK